MGERDRQQHGPGGNDVAKKALRQRVMAGETVPGAMVFEFFSPGMAQVLAHAGAEYVIYDMEHTGIGTRDRQGAGRPLPRHRHRTDGACAARRISLPRPRARHRLPRRHDPDGGKRRSGQGHRRGDALSPDRPARRGLRLRARRLRSRRSPDQDEGRRCPQARHRPDRDRARLSNMWRPLRRCRASTSCGSAISI